MSRARGEDRSGSWDYAAKQRQAGEGEVMSKLPDYLKSAIDEYADWRVDRTRADLEAAIERYAQESVAADYRKRWQESYGKLIEENPETFPPFIDNPPPIG